MPFQGGLADMQDRLEESERLQTAMDTELTEVRGNLRILTEQHRGSEKALQDRINEDKAEIEELKKDAATATCQITSDRTTLEKLMSEKILLADQIRIVEKRRETQEETNSTIIRYLSTELNSVISQNVRAKAQISQLKETLIQRDGEHKAEVQGFNMENGLLLDQKNTLSGRNDKQESTIEHLQKTLEEIEEALSQECDELRVQNQLLSSESDALKADKADLTRLNAQQQAENLALKTDKVDLTRQKAHCQAENLALEAEKDDLANCSGEYQDEIE